MYILTVIAQILILLLTAFAAGVAFGSLLYIPAKKWARRKTFATPLPGADLCPPQRPLVKPAHYAIVATVTRVPKYLDDYAEDAKKHHRDAMFIVIDEEGASPEIDLYCRALAARSGMRIEHFSVDRQAEYLSAYPNLPFSRKEGVGILYAYEIGSRVIVAIGDEPLTKRDHLGD